MDEATLNRYLRGFLDYPEEDQGGSRKVKVFARGWLIERARVRRLREELERVRTERDDLRSQLHHHPGWTEW